MNIGRYKLIDSSSFMPESLEVLSENLKSKGENYFKNTNKWLGGSIKKFELLTSKGIYPYEYMTDFARVFETSLPPKEDFYSSLKEAHISESDYNKAQEIWTEFSCTSLGSYTKLYCESDVHLLADCWTNFCNETSKNLFIHPEAGFISLPSYAFEAFKHKLKMEHNECLQVLGDAHQQFQEDVTKGIRGGSCMVKQKAAFDSAMKAHLLEQANDSEKEEYRKIKIMYQKQAKSISRKILGEVKGKPISISICKEEGCSELVWSKSKKCIQHADWTLLALDFNNLHWGGGKHYLSCTGNDRMTKYFSEQKKKFKKIYLRLFCHFLHRTKKIS